MALRLYKDDIKAIARRLVELLLEQKEDPIDNDEDWETADEAAKILKISLSRIYIR